MATAAAASRYDILLKLAAGGMATVYIGQVRGALGFRQLVAIKRPHPHLLDDASFRTELLAEARLASMISHANVVDVRDVEITGSSISLVMDYIEGASLGELLVASAREGKPFPPRVAVRVALDALAGLHAAHELVDERGRPVSLVHRDVSPQNILVGSDGIARVVDFGVAKFARKNLPSTSGSTLKGKLAYMAPEYVRGETIDRRFDVFALGIVLWEALTGRRLFRGANEVETLKRVVEHVAEPPSAIVPSLGTALDDVLATALAKAPEERFQNAAAMAAALERSALEAGLLGGASDVVATLKALVGPAIEERRGLVRAKLAHEPSVASLMGVPPLVADQVAAATLDAPPDGEAKEATRTVVEERPTPGPSGSTLPLAPPTPPPPPPPARAAEGTGAAYTLLSAGTEPSSGSAPAWAPPRARSWGLPLVAFGGVLALTLGGGAYALRDRGAAKTERAEEPGTPASATPVVVPPPPPASAPATSATAAATSATSARPAASASPASVAPQTTTRPAASTPARPTPKPPSSHVAAPAKSAAPASSTRKPPENPYE